MDGVDEPKDCLTLDNCPKIHSIQPECVVSGDYVTVYGRNLSEIEGLYLIPLSGADIPTEDYEPFAFSEALSGECPPFEGDMIEEFQTLDQDNIIFKVPDYGVDNNVDILVTNRHCGYTKLSTTDATVSPCGEDIDRSDQNESCRQKFLNIN